MPYIDPKRRPVLDQQAAWGAETMGELVYILTNDVLDYLVGHGESFQTYGEILGALDATARELYRRRIASFEDRKIRENGDVYPVTSPPPV